MVRYDLHTHSTYSDGWDWQEMAATAESLGLEGIGITDHCPVVTDTFGRRDRFDLVETYEDRRKAFQEYFPDIDVRIFDAAEVNYEPRVEDEIASFLKIADFEYTIGSVHITDTVNVTDPELASADDATLRTAVETYVDWQVQLIESELFDIVGHLDVPQRSPHLRGVMRTEDYERMADALAGADVVPEINAGRLDRSLGDVHPNEDTLEIFAERDIPFVIGTDSHAPDQLRARVALLRERLPEFPVRLIDVPPGLTH